MSDSTEVLLIEDNPGDARLMQELLAEDMRGSFRLECVDRLSAGIERLASRQFDVILLDLGLPDSQGFDTFVKLHTSVPQIPIVILSGLTDEEIAAKAVREGAQDYLVKAHVDSNVLRRSLRYAIERNQVELELQKYREHLEELVEQRTKMLSISERKYRNLADSITDIFFAMDKDLRYTYWNKASEKLTGIAAEDAFGKQIYDLFPDDEGTRRAIEMYQAVLRTRQSRCFTNETHLYGGDYVFEISAYATEDGLSVFVKDITERERVEEMLRDANQRWVSLTENTNDFIMIADSKGRIKYINRAIPPHSVEYVIGKTLYDFAMPEHHEIIRESMRKVFETGKTLGYESSVEHPAGILWFDTKIVPITDGKTVVNVMMFNSNITERKQAEEALRKSEERYRNLFQLAPDAIFTIDTKGRIASANLAAFNLTGFSQDELVGKHFSKLPTARLGDIPKYAKMLVTLLKGKTPEPFEAAFYTKDGEQRWGEVHVSLIKSVGKVIGIQAVTRDITKRKQVEEELKISRQELRSLVLRLQSVREEERISIARDIHDELGQALTALQVDLSWLRRHLPESDKTLMERAQRMTGLIDTTIRETQRISSSLRPSILDDLGLIPAIEWQMNEFQERTGLKCELSLSDKPLTLNHETSTAAFRILQETLTNIARHSGATDIRVSLKEQKGRLVLEVKDNGKGITEEEIAKTTSLGLIGMRERARALNGEVAAKGIPGRGTTVTVSIPLSRENGTQ